METTTAYWGTIRILGKKMETTIVEMCVLKSCQSSRHLFLGKRIARIRTHASQPLPAGIRTNCFQPMNVHLCETRVEDSLNVCTKFFLFFDKALRDGNYTVPPQAKVIYTGLCSIVRLRLASNVACRGVSFARV